MALPIITLILLVPALLVVVIGSILLRRALISPKILPEEIAWAVAWVFLIGALFWLGVYLTDSTFIGFGAPWTWLTAAHFAFVGFGALAITALSCRVVANRSALFILKLLVLTHPILYLITAGGILGYRYCDEIDALGYELLFLTQLSAVILGRPHRMDRWPMSLLLFALTVPVATLVPAIAWAWGRPFFDLSGMVRYHGIVNAVGHVGLGLGAFALCRPPSHAVELMENVSRK